MVGLAKDASADDFVFRINGLLVNGDARSPDGRLFGKALEVDGLYGK